MPLVHTNFSLLHARRVYQSPQFHQANPYCWLKMGLYPIIPYCHVTFYLTHPPRICITTLWWLRKYCLVPELADCFPNTAVTLKINGGSLGPCSCATWCYCAGAYGLNEMLVRTSGGLCRTNLFQYRPLVDVLLNNYGKEKHACARWSLTASERDVLMHLSKVDTSAASLSVSHTPLWTLSHCPLDSDRDFHLSWGSGSVMLFDMCLLLLGFSWVIQRIWSSPLTTAAAAREGLWL